MSYNFKPLVQKTKEEQEDKKTFKSFDEMMAEWNAQFDGLDQPLEPQAQVEEQPLEPEIQPLESQPFDEIMNEWTSQFDSVEQPLEPESFDEVMNEYLNMDTQTTDEPLPESTQEPIKPNLLMRGVNKLFGVSDEEYANIRRDAQERDYDALGETLRMAGSDPLLQGLTYGFADEIAGGIGKLAGRDYEEVRDSARDQYARESELYPGAQLGGEITGSVAGSLATGMGVGAAGRALVPSLMSKLPTLGTLGRVGLGTVAGAADAALYGVGTSEADSFGGVAADAATMGALGGAIGGTVPAAGAGLRAIKEGGLTRLGLGLSDIPMLKTARKGLGVTTSAQEDALTTMRRNPDMFRGGEDAVRKKFRDISRTKIPTDIVPIDRESTELINTALTTSRKITNLDTAIANAPDAEMARRLRRNKNQFIARLKEEGVSVAEARKLENAFRKIEAPKAPTEGIRGVQRPTSDGQGLIGLSDFTELRNDLYVLGGRGKPKTPFQRKINETYQTVNDNMKKFVKEASDNPNLNPQQKKSLDVWNKKLDADEIFKATKELDKLGNTSGLNQMLNLGAIMNLSNPLTLAVTQGAKTVTDPLLIPRVGRTLDNLVINHTPEAIKPLARRAAEGVTPLARGVTSPTGRTIITGAAEPIMRDDEQQVTDTPLNFASMLPTLGELDSSSVLDDVGQQTGGQVMPQQEFVAPFQDIGRQAVDSVSDDDFFNRLDAIRKRRMGN